MQRTLPVPGNGYPVQGSSTARRFEGREANGRVETMHIILDS
jgi:hypothetical protein